MVVQENNKVEETQDVFILLNVYSCFHNLITTQKLFLFLKKKRNHVMSFDNAFAVQTHQNVIILHCLMERLLKQKNEGPTAALAKFQTKVWS